MNDFHHIMSERSDLELYRILYYEADKYQAEALEAAKTEFSKRNIGQTVFKDFENQIRLKAENEGVLTVEKQQEIKDKIKHILDFLKPKDDDPYEKRALLISMFLAIVYGIQVISDFKLLWALVTSFPDWDLSVLEIFLTYSIIPIGIYGLWKFKKYGWYITIAFLCYFAVVNSLLTIQNYVYPLMTDDFINITMDAIFKRPSMSSLLMRILIIIGILHYLNKMTVLRLYAVKPNVRWIVISAIILITMLLWGSLLVVF